ncbi:hypothetical protein JMJ35_010207 [Cladonia borealis]|uniref:Uncharacterized protein n=1 Tax=Cladonia borealis TaxID=184061 RepID=A0AA39QSN1_9LECA|nr:hypothetical protein JMJ35_010207 [Cladonia borealis]
MSSAEEEEHLKGTELNGSNVKKILEDFQIWLDKAHFEVVDRAKSEMLQRCDDPGLAEASQPLLIAFGFYNQMHSRRRTYSVLRILPSYTAPLENPTGSADLIPIRIIEGTPTVSGQALIPARSVHITKGVRVSSALDLLVVVTH